ncbi:MAG: hypothetical protein ACRCSO_00260 [Sphingomonas sp.]
MSISSVVYEMRANVERVRAEQGDAAAEKFEREQAHGVIGGHIAGTAGALSGAAIGSMILPGVGTVVGGVIGLIAGITRGVGDRSLKDNVKTTLSAGTSMYRDLK